MVADGVTDGPVLDALKEVGDDNITEDHPISHEEALLLACVPEQLRTKGFAPVSFSFPVYTPPEGMEDDQPQKELAKAINAMFDGIASINGKVEHLIKIQQVHTLAHLANIRSTSLLRLLCVQDGAKKDKTYRNLMISMKSVILGSDPDLKDLPFRSVVQIEVFFKDINNVVKLAHFLLAFVEWDRFYTARLLDTVIHMKLQRTVYWKSGTGKNGCVCE